MINHQGDSYAKMTTTRKSKETNTTQIRTFQQLYDLLSRKGKDFDISNNKYRSATKSKAQNSLQSKAKINISYETTQLQKRVSSYQINRVAKLVKSDGLNSKLDAFCNHKASLYPRGNKYSNQTTNQKLKNIILGKRNKKGQFFQSRVNQEQTTGILPKCERLQPINEQILTNRRIFTQKNQQLSFRTVENKKTKIFKERDERLEAKIKKMKTEEPQSINQPQASPKYKQPKPNKRLKINGQHLVSLLKHSSKTSEIKQDQKSTNIEVAQNKTIMEQLTKQKTKISEDNFCKRKSSSPVYESQKNQNKASLYLSLLSTLPISQHVIWKIQKMLDFNQFFLKSFGCEFTYSDSRLLKKYNRNNNFCTYYVGAGNNRSLIIQLFRKRWWWKQVATWENADFVWTQQKNSKIFGFLSQKKGDYHKLNADRTMLNQPKLNQVLKKKPQKRCDKQLQKLLTNSYKSKTNLKIDSLQLKLLQRPQIMCNHIQKSNFIGDKKDLFNLLRLWILYKKDGTDELYSFIPQTYHFKNMNTTTYSDYLKTFKQNKQEKTIWIVKPGQNSNRGRGIFLSQDKEQIGESVQNRFELGGTTIVQKYKADLVLYKGRKFDIRTYMLCIIIGDTIKYFWYSQGYIRTSSHLFNLKQLNSLIHLTNDAIQNKGEMYGRYQKGNKLSYNQLQTYLNQTFPLKQYKMDSLTTKMKEIAKKVASASYFLIDKIKTLSFQLFGLDFIVDYNFDPWLLQVNTNPCLQISCPVLQNAIPSLVENVFRLAVDPLFPPNMLPDKDHEYNLPQKIIDCNKFQLIFDSQIQRDQEWQNFCDLNWQTQKIDNFI